MGVERRDLGKAGEELAARYLERRGYTVISRNFRVRGGEIDIIARQGGDLVFIEVKTRRGDSHGSPFEAVDARKRQRLTRAAMAYLSQTGQHGQPARFDVVAVRVDGASPRVELVRNAFEAAP